MLTLATFLLSAPAQASTALVVNASNDTLVAVDTNSFASFPVAALPFAYDFGDATYDPNTGNFYIIVARPSPALYAFNVNTGVFTSIGALAIDEIFAAGLDPVTGRLWAIQNSSSNLYVINTNNANTTFVATTNVFADGGYWDVQRNALVVNQIGAQDFFSVDMMGFATPLASNGSFTDNNDFDLDRATGQLFAWDWSSTQRTYSAATFALLGQTASGFSSDAMAIIDSAPPMGPMISSVGTCPGPVTITVNGLTAGGQVAFVRANATGSFTVPSGACAGTNLGLNAPQLLTTMMVPPGGTLTIPANLGAGQCTKYFQAVDLSTCQVSNVWQP